MQGEDLEGGRPLVVDRLHEPAAASDDRMARRLQRASSVPGTGRLRAGDLPPSSRVEAHLARLVARQPTNSRAHLVRLNRALEARDRDATYAALLDLFIGLGERGRKLRERALAASAGVIGTDEQELLQLHLTTGIRPEAPVPIARGSVLTRGLTGTPILVAPSGYRRAGRDVEEEATALLADGRTAEARRVLEHALLRGRQPDEVHELLLEIYRRAGDDERLASVRERIRAAVGPLPPCWTTTTGPSAR